MLRVALFCDESAGAQTLSTIARSEHELVAILTSPPGSSRGRTGVWRVAENLGYAPIPARRVRDPAFIGEIGRLGVDLVLNVHSLYIVPEDVLRVPTLGSFNLHPGPLPRYAGLNAPSWAIYRGEAQHGVTLHKMEPGIDTGPIVYQEMFAIEPEDTGLSLSVRCIQRGLPLLERLLEVAGAGLAIPLISQDLDRREDFGKDVPQAGWLRWTDKAQRIHDFVRACDFQPFTSPWGTARSRVGETEVSIAKTALTGIACDAAPGTVQHGEAGEVLVATADEWVVVRALLRLGRRCSPEEVLHPGARLE
jgi:UDP-4-amino-4-deoxy-L-arabinose formyltransferase/UDP-glucuronic acid dehydrogenase (UDP-4-keto-hexauronic acid decarboxylating)